MGDDPSQRRWPSRLTPHSSRAVITEGAREMAVDDFIDSHLRERAHPRRGGRGKAPRPPPPPPSRGGGPAAPPRPGTRTEPVLRPQVKTVPMQAVVPARPVPAAPPPPTPAATPDDVDDEGGGSTMLLSPEQALAAQASLGAAMAAAAAPALPPQPAVGLGGTMLIPAVPDQTSPPARAPLPTNGMDEIEKAWGPVRAPIPAGVIQPAEPQGPAPTPRPVEAYPESTYVPPKRKASPIGLILLGVGIAVLAGGAIAYWQGLFAGRPAPSSEATAAATATTREPTASPIPSVTGAPATSPAEPASSAASVAVPASAAPSATAEATSVPPQSTPPPADAKSLLSFEGALTVKSSADAEVVVHGQAAGRTNQRLVVRCGSKNVRLRAEGTKWITEGQHVHVVCMQDTTVTIEPSP